MQNILACLIFWWAIGAFSRPPLGISMPYALWHCCLLCWGLQVTIYFDKFMVFMLIVPSWRWSSGGAHSIDLTRGWCPLNIEIDVQASKLVASGTFGAICYSFACCCFCYLSPRSVHTAGQQIKKSNFRILNCTFTPLSWLWMFYWTRQQKIQKPLFVSFSTADFFGRYGSCIRQCIFWQVHDGRK